MNEMESLKPELDRVQRQSLTVGGVALLLCVVGAFFNAEQFFRSYLVAYLFWISIPLGSFAVLMLHHLVGGAWGFVIRRLLEAATRTIWLMLILFLPILVGLTSLYEWTHAETVAADELLQHKESYLNIPFFLARAVIYFGLWLVGMYFLNKWSTEQDRTHDAGLTRRLQVLSGPGLLLWGATITFMSIDWVMSLEPAWYSAIFGMLFMVGQGLTTLAFMIVALSRLWNQPPLLGVVTRSHFHDLGSLMLTFVMLWAYVGFSQFLIIWSGNLPEEIPWYLHRTHGGWQQVGASLMIFHFALPFLLLLSRTTKGSIVILSTLAATMLLMRWVDVFWLVMPTFQPAQLQLHWLDPVAVIGVGGLWVGTFGWQLKREPLLPLYDPRLEESLQGVRELLHGTK